MGESLIGGFLVVEDDPRLCATLVEALGRKARDVRAAHSVRACRQILESFTPDFVILDVALPDGSAFSVIDSIQEIQPMPVIIAMSGHAGPDESFRLAQLGVRFYLSKPLRLQDLDRAIDEARIQTPKIGPQLKASVGRVPMKQVEEQVRKTMVEEALARAGGSRRGAARLLSVSRQFLQHFLKRS